MPQRYRLALLLIALLAWAPVVAAQGILYVKADATGLNDGTSWPDAFTDLQEALAVAQEGDQIWVAAGTYRPHVIPDPENIRVADRSVFFELKNGVQLYGGFAGTETRLDQRDAGANVTILSGDLLANDNDNLSIHEPTRFDNSFHVVFAGAGIDASAVLDGFTITGGNADPPPNNPDDTGGGLVAQGASPVVRNVRFIANTAQFGGGMGTISFAAPFLQNVSFIENAASLRADCNEPGLCAGDGGGMYNVVSGPTLEHVTFIGNDAENNGGALVNRGSPIIMTHSLFLDNRAVRGGAIYNRGEVGGSGGDQVIVNAALYGNEATQAGGAVYNEDVSPVFINALFSGNRSLNPDNRGGGAMYNLTLFDTQRISPLLWNATFSNNRSESDGGAIYNVNSGVRIFHGILWGNRAVNGEDQIGRVDDRGTTQVGQSLVEGGVPPWVDVLDGTEILDADPLFADADGLDGFPGTDDDDLHLLAGSPAIDAGINASLPPDAQDLDGDGSTSERFSIDLDGNQRIFNATGLATAIVDLGAYEFGAPPAIPTTTEPVADERPDGTALVAAFPNPFRDRATLRYTVPATGRVVLRVYDLLGRAVATLVDGDKAPGTYEATFEAPHVPSGVYLYRLDAAGHAATGTLVRTR